MFFTLSTISLVLFLSFISFSIFLYACITVEWSRLPNSSPIFGNDKLAISLHRYIAIYLGKAISLDLLSLAKSSLLTLKYLATVSFIKSADITFSLCCLNSFIVFSASSIEIGSLLREAIATILLNTPSNSLMFESILLAMFDNI